MEYSKGALKDNDVITHPTHQHEADQASNSYMMAVVSVIAGMPLPIINLIATAGYYLSQRRSSYFVRWHCIQAALGQIVLIPFNSLAMAWTIGIVLRYEHDYFSNTDENIITDNFPELSALYWLYITFVLLVNIAEFIVVIVTASKVRKGHNVRWWGIAAIADRLTSKEDRNPYKL